MHSRLLTLLDAFPARRVAVIGDLIAEVLELHDRKRFEIVGFDYKDSDEAGLAWLGRHGNPYRSLVADPAGVAVVGVADPLKGQMPLAFAVVKDASKIDNNYLCPLFNALYCVF